MLAEVRGIAEYARIALDEDEIRDMCAYLNDAMELLEPILAYDLEGVEPTFHPIGSLVNVLAEDAVDVHGRSLDRQACLDAAASVADGAFRVPAILGKAGGVA